MLYCISIVCTCILPIYKTHLLSDADNNKSQPDVCPREACTCVELKIRDGEACTSVSSFHQAKHHQMDRPPEISATNGQSWTNSPNVTNLITCFIHIQTTPKHFRWTMNSGYDTAQ